MWPDTGKEHLKPALGPQGGNAPLWFAALLDKLHPIVAAILHNVGSLIVIFNRARLVRQGEGPEHYHPVPAERPAAPRPPRLSPQMA